MGHGKGCSRMECYDLLQCRWRVDFDLSAYVPVFGVLTLTSVGLCLWLWLHVVKGQLWLFCDMHHDMQGLGPDAPRDHGHAPSGSLDFTGVIACHLRNTALNCLSLYGLQP